MAGKTMTDGSMALQEKQRRVERKLLPAGKYFSFVGAAAPIVVE